MRTQAPRLSPQSPGFRGEGSPGCGRRHVLGTVVATLAATHKSARHENAKAYAHGMNDMLKSVRQSIRDGVDPFEI